MWAYGVVKAVSLQSGIPVAMDHVLSTLKRKLNMRSGKRSMTGKEI